MNLTIHRGSKEIGGTCIELQTSNTRILLDFGLPLVDEGGEPHDGRRLAIKSKDELVEKGLLPDIEGALIGQPPTVDAILLSHAHLDHYGLISFVHPDIPIFASKGSKKLIEISAFFGQTNCSTDNVTAIQPWKSFQVGDFSVTPYLVDHSGFDAFAYLLEAEGKRIFYSGDFRAHGRKGKVFTKLIKEPPKDIDYLLIEGTMIDRDTGPHSTETDIEKALIDQFRGSKDLFFIACSSQNIDRLVSVYRACLQSGRTLVLDPYTAYVLDKLKDISPNIPQFNWGKNIGVYYTKGSHSKKLFETKDAYKYKSAKIIFSEITANKSKFIIKDSFAMRNKFVANNELHDTTLIFSQWEGYLPDQQPFWEEQNVPITHIHCSGHAYVRDLQTLAKALQPKHLIPIHTFHPEQFTEHFDNVLLPTDGHPIEL